MTYMLLTSFDCDHHPRVAPAQSLGLVTTQLGENFSSRRLHLKRPLILQTIKAQQLKRPLILQTIRTQLLKWPLVL